MKAVEYCWDYGIRTNAGWFPMLEGAPDSWMVGGVPSSRGILKIRYDNGQLCVFRRKTKGQNNER